MQKLWWRRSCCAFSPCALCFSPFPKLSKSIHGKKEREEDGLLYLSARCMVKTLTYQVLKQRKENLKFWRGLLFFVTYIWANWKYFLGTKDLQFPQCWKNTYCEFHLKNNEMMGKEKSFNFYGKEKNICLILLMLAHTHHFSISHRKGLLCRAVLEKPI